VTSSFANFFSVLTSLVYGNDGLTGNKASIHTLSPLFFHTALLHAVPKFQGVFIACYPFLMKNDGPRGLIAGVQSLHAIQKVMF
jgi:hypothetical protein